MADQQGDFSAAIDAGKKLGDKREIHGGYYTVLGQGDRIEDLEKLLIKPRRVRAKTAMNDVPSFNDYFNAFKQDRSRLFANRDEFRIVGVLDYHGDYDNESIDGQDPSWCTHHVTYMAPRSPEWMTWTGADGKRMSQLDFAQFIENNVDDINTPPGAEMLEISRSLQAKKSVDFASAIRLANGEQEFSYAEVIQGSSSKGKLSIPEKFVIGIPVFVNDQPYAVEARLRYRINESKLSLWYDLHQADKIEHDAFNKIVTMIADNTGVVVWMGSP